MDLIQKINKSHGLGEDDAKRAHDDPVLVLRGRLERACERLSRDLYNTKTHFLLEFVQNADDNDYNVGTVPNLQLKLHGHQLMIRCNEKGFLADNVEAICDVGHSTKRMKRGTEGYIGEKGIGFKAVFVVAKHVHVSSQEFTFRFDRDGSLGMINPIWDPSHPSDLGWTTFRLDIAHDVNMVELREEIRTIKPTLLLFLRRLRTIDLEVIQDDNACSSGSTKLTISRIDEPDNIVGLEYHENGVCTSSSRYIVFKQITPTFLHEDKRQGVTESEIVLAFPVMVSGEPEVSSQFVHAFLPVAKYGLPFVVQADFLTPSSREGIILDSKWNSVLFEGVITSFVDAMVHFQQDPSLRDTWMRYVPLHARSPFSTVAEGIITRLQAEEILLSADGRYRQPQCIVAMPKGFRTHRDEPVIPSQFLPSIHYLADSYDFSRDRQVLMKLGVKPMSDQNILDGLTNMDRADVIKFQDDRWHSIVCSCLSGMPQSMRDHNKQFLDLRLLPLNDGSWRPLREASQHIFVTDMEIAQDVEFKCIWSGVKEFSARWTFMQAMGVRIADPMIVATKILLSASKTASLESLIRYARFFYEHRNLKGVPRPSGKFEVMDEHGCVAKSNELYIETPESAVVYGFKLRDILPPEANFLHPDYTVPYTEDHYWLAWLHDSLGLHTSPRIISARPTSDLLSMARKLGTSQFLAVLRAFWSQISVGLSSTGFTDLSDTEVVCDDGVAYPLGTTALRRRNLSWLPPALASCLRFVSVVDPDDASWSFLAKLGVTLEPDANAWVGILLRLQQTNSGDERTVFSVYQQLNIRFAEAPQYIHSSFHRHPLIFAPPNGQGRTTASWLPFSEVFWSGPSTVRKKFIVKSVYATLEDFFCWKLGMPDVPMGVLIEELVTFAEVLEGLPLTEDVVWTLEQMLTDISWHLAWAPQSDPCLQGLLNRAVFPVYIGGDVRLHKFGEFFVSEKGGKTVEQFRATVPILAISSPQALSQLRALFESRVWPYPVRVLETSLVAGVSPLGRLRFDQEATTLYSSRSEYMEKYVLHVTKYSPLPRQMEFLSKMRRITVYVVDTIVLMWYLDGRTVSVQPNVKVSIQEGPDQILFYVSQSCASMPNTRDREICSLLGDQGRVAIDKLALLQFVSMPWEELMLFLEDEGVPISLGLQQRQRATYRWQPGLPDVPDIPISAPQSSGAPLSSTEWPDSHEASELQTPIRRRSDNGSVATPSPSSPAAGLKTGDMPWNGPRPGPLSPNKPRRHNRSSSTLDQSTVRMLELSAVSPIAFPTLRLPHGSGGEFDDYRSSQDDDRDSSNGVYGELHVFRMLQHTLGPDFTEDNWTSELRGLVPGFSPYLGPSLSDFRYEDTSGILTNLWFGTKQKRAWKSDRWPTFHLEVKTTSGSVNEPFHMSSAQLQSACQFSSVTRANRADPPQDVYAIIRVSEIKSEHPKHCVYLDPYKWICDGGLVIRGDVDLVPP